MERGVINRLSSGIQGLDELLHGGYIAERMYLVLGGPGTGKTLLGGSFLADGLDRGENVLVINGEESREELLVNAARVGVDLGDADFLDLGPDSGFFSEERSYEIVNPRDISDDRLVEAIREAIEEFDPRRVLIDPISQLKSIEPTEYQYRKRIISFMRFLRERGTTVLVTQTPAGEHSDLKSLSDGIIRLRYSENGRRIGIRKHRVESTPDGSHGMQIRDDGIDVFPSLVPASHDREFEPKQIFSGIDGLDTLIGGGLERGTVTIISGPTGIGKSTTATEFLETAASEGVSGLIYLFEENADTFVHRSEALGIPVTELQERNLLTVEEVEPLAMSPEEFAQQVRTNVEQRNVEFVVIDGTDGYKQSLHGERANTTRRLHALTRYLRNMNVSVILTDEISQVTGLAQPTSENISYLGDNIIFMNYIERDGHIERVIGMLKKRVGKFEDTLRLFTFTDDGIEVGSPMTDVRGILEGTPELIEEPPSRHAD
jgi:circadian clock protein KaiC